MLGSVDAEGPVDAVEKAFGYRPKGLYKLNSRTDYAKFICMDYPVGPTREAKIVMDEPKVQCIIVTRRIIDVKKL